MRSQLQDWYTIGGAEIGIFKVLVLDFKFFQALTTWPKFSVSSYKIVSSLVKQGICPQTVIDVGGNLGQFSVAAAKLWPESTLYTFEPIPRCVEAIRRCSARLDQRIQITPCAIGETPGVVEFHINSHIQASSILPLTKSHLQSFPNAQEQELIQVKVSTLDLELKDVEFQGLTLLKIDTQGYEPNVIRGAAETLKRIDYALLEVSFKEMYEGELLFSSIQDLMELHQFRFLRPISCFTDPKTKEILQMDALFMRQQP